jgi:hypothetical protein
VVELSRRARERARIPYALVLDLEGIVGSPDFVLHALSPLPHLKPGKNARAGVCLSQTTLAFSSGEKYLDGDWLRSGPPEKKLV